MNYSDFDMPTEAPPQAGWGGKESQVMARFYKGQKLDAFQSAQAGTPIAKSLDMVEIRQYGEKDSTILEVTEIEKRRFPRAWQAYVQGLEQVQDGTPLAALFPANPEVVETLKGFHVYTVQALLAVPDSVTAIPFLFDHKKKAAEYLEGIEKGKGFHALEKRLEDSELKRMEQDELIKTLSARLTELEKEKPTKATKE